MRHHFARRGPLLALALLVLAAPVSSAQSGVGLQTAVGIERTQFLINGVPSYDGTAVEGLLLNARMINAAFDDENASTVGNWGYPDTDAWNADRNTDEFVAAAPSYAAAGLRAVTVGLQGGRPMRDTAQTWNVSAFEADGSLKAAWLDRLDRVIRACDANGIVVIVSLFYKAQDQRLDDESAVLRAVDGTTDWLLARGYTNVLVEIGNESNDVGWDHAILYVDRIDELIARVQSRSGGRLLVSTSFGGGYIPPDDVVRQSDFVVVHGNHQSASGIASMVDKIRAKSVYAADPKPIVFNEDSTDLTKLDAATEKGASWGYHDAGTNDYVNGFQSVPVNWKINTDVKRAFFDRVRTLSGSAEAEPPPDPDSTLLVSRSADRSGAVVLGSSAVSGDVFVFADVENASEVRFHIDDPEASNQPVQVERGAPYDLAGTARDGSAYAYDTTALANGDHLITAVVIDRDGSTVTLTASFPVDNRAPQLAFDPNRVAVSAETGSTVEEVVRLTASNGAQPTFTLSEDADWLSVIPSTGSPPADVRIVIDAAALGPGDYSATVVAEASGYGASTLGVSLTVTQAEPPTGTADGLFVSTHSDRSDPIALDGASVAGAVYIFATDLEPAVAVAFYLDDPARAGEPFRVEINAPFDFAGSVSDGTPRAFDTSALPEGTRAITAVFVRSDGTEDVVTARFSRGGA